MLGAQNVNRRSQNEMDGFRTLVSMCYAQEGDEFMDSIMTGDETWVFHHAPESNQQLLHCHHTYNVVQRAGSTLL
jgi:hypothetical protein